MDIVLYFCYIRNMRNQDDARDVRRRAERFAAMGNEARLRILRLLLSAHPGGMVAGSIQEEMRIPASTLSHHLEKLRREDLIQVRREGTFLRYTTNAGVLQDLLAFLFAECCTRSKAVRPEAVTRRAP
jgi:ArsR family transcriptional regulator, arsenate/arsenite/antimonite-responsive transcriptional repressor